MDEGEKDAWVVVSALVVALFMAAPYLGDDAPPPEPPAAAAAEAPAADEPPAIAALPTEPNEQPQPDGADGVNGADGSTDGAVTEVNFDDGSEVVVYDNGDVWIGDGLAASEWNEEPGLYDMPDGWRTVQVMVGDRRQGAVVEIDMGDPGNPGEPRYLPYGEVESWYNNDLPDESVTYDIESTYDHGAVKG